jgi:osmotically-inducible protein OsmY
MFKAAFGLLKSLALVAVGFVLGVVVMWQLFGQGTLRGWFAERRVERAAGDAASAVQDAGGMDFDAIRREVVRSGRVVFEKMNVVGSSISDAAADLKITALVKGKLASDRVLMNRLIGVSTSRGRVRLTGQVSSAEEITKAMLLAYDTPGVEAVESELRIGPE